MSATNVRPVAQGVRFILTGGLNTLFGYLVFAGLTRLGWSDLVVLPVAYAAGIAFNFVTFGKLVFESSGWARLPRFILGYAGLYVCNLTGLRALMRLGASAYVAQALLVVPLALLSYVINDRWVFRAK